MAIWIKRLDAECAETRAGFKHFQAKWFGWNPPFAAAEPFPYTIRIAP